MLETVDEIREAAACYAVKKFEYKGSGAKNLASRTVNGMLRLLEDAQKKDSMVYLKYGLKGNGRRKGRIVVRVTNMGWRQLRQEFVNSETVLARANAFEIPSDFRIGKCVSIAQELVRQRFSV